MNKNRLGVGMPRYAHRNSAPPLWSLGRPILPIVSLPMARPYQKDVYKFEPDNHSQSDWVFFRSEKKKNIWMIHSLSRSSGSKTHFFLSLILGISWHEKSLKIFASPWPIQNHRACRSGPMAAVPGSTRSLEMVVKPAKWSSSTAWRQDPIHGDTITRKHQKPGLNNQKLPDSSWFIHFGGDRLNG